MLAQIFNRVVPNIANYVCGKTNPKDREDMLADFRNGSLPILTNCGVMTEGVDVPRAEVIVPKPTKSHALAIQMYGRGLRPPEVDGKSIVNQHASASERRAAISRSRKPCCTILDLYGVTGRHKMVTSPDVLGGDYSEEVIELTKQEQKSSARPMDISEALAAAKEKLRKQQEQLRQEEAARKRRIIVPTRFAISKTDPLDTHDVTQVKMYKPKLMADSLSPKQQWILTNRLGRTRPERP